MSHGWWPGSSRWRRSLPAVGLSADYGAVAWGGLAGESQARGAAGAVGRVNASPPEAAPTRSVVAHRRVVQSSTAAYRHHVWAYACSTRHGRMTGGPLKILTVLEEYSRECTWRLSWRTRLRSLEVLETLAELFVTCGVPAAPPIRCPGPEFTATLIRPWLAALHVARDVVHRAGESLGDRVSQIVQRLEVTRRPASTREIFYTLTEAGRS